MKGRSPISFTLFTLNVELIQRNELHEEHSCEHFDTRSACCALPRQNCHAISDGELVKGLALPKSISPYPVM